MKGAGGVAAARTFFFFCFRRCEWPIHDEHLMGVWITMAAKWHTPAITYSIVFTMPMCMCTYIYMLWNEPTQRRFGVHGHHQSFVSLIGTFRMQSEKSKQKKHRRRAWFGWFFNLRNAASHGVLPIHKKILSCLHWEHSVVYAMDDATACYMPRCHITSGSVWPRYSKSVHAHICRNTYIQCASVK